MDNHGEAQFSDETQLAKAGLLGGTGNYLGVTYTAQTPIIYKGNDHILTVAPPGTGKTVGVVIPSLLSNPNSTVVSDPKGAVTAQTMRYRRDVLGQRIVILNPWQEEISEGLGLDLGDTGFNPMSLLKNNTSLHDNSKMLGGILCPTPHDSRDPYWTDTGRDLLILGMLYLVTMGDKPPTLPALHDLISGTRVDWCDLAEKMEKSGNPHLIRYAKKIATPLESEKQWSGVQGKASAALSIYCEGDPLGDHVSKNDFDPSDLKRENITVYIVIPSNRRDANKAWLGLVMTLCAEAVGRAGVSKPVTILAEEFANLGYLPSMPRAMAEYREAGLQVHLVIQNIHQLTRIYGRDGAQEIIGLCAVKQFFGIDDLETAQNIENFIGTFTANAQSTSTPDDFMQFGSTSESQIGVPLRRAQELLNFNESEQIILVRGSVPPILALVKPFIYDQNMINATDPNPYRDEPAERTALTFIAPENAGISDAATSAMAGKIARNFGGFMICGIIAANIEKDNPQSIGLLDIIYTATILWIFFYTIIHIFRKIFWGKTPKNDP